MKKYVDGKYIEMTAEEIEAMQAETPEEKEKPTFEERLGEIEKNFKKIEKFLLKLGW